MSSLHFRKIINSTGWMSIALGLGQLINFFCVLIAARYLDPAVYGNYSTGMIIIAFTAIMARFGLLEAIVQIEPSDTRETSTAATLSLIFSFSSWVLTVIVGLVLSVIWNRVDLLLLSAVLGLSSITYGLQSLPEAILRKSFKFRQISIVRLISNFIGALVLIALIMHSPSVWALVAQRLTVEFVAMLFFWLWVKPSIKFQWSSRYARKLMFFGKGIGSANIIDVLSNQTDQIIVRIFWGEQGLGLYSMAKRLLANIQQFMFMPFRQVTISALAGLDGDVPQISLAYKNGTRLMTGIGIAAAWVLFFGIDPVVQMLFSAKWFDCIPILKILCWIVIYDAFIIMYPAVVQSAKKPHWIAWERFLLVVIGSIAMVIIAYSGYDLRIAAFSVLIQSYVTLPLILFFIWKLLGSIIWGVILDLLVCMGIVTAIYLGYDYYESLNYYGTNPLTYMMNLALPTTLSFIVMGGYLYFSRPIKINVVT